MGPPVAVNIDFYDDISDFWALVLSEWYGYSMQYDNISGQQLQFIT
jgi:hypothetical protein